MKIRHDFVTNSSSSSYIISTKQEVPSLYKDIVKRVTKENVPEIIKSISDYEWTTITYEMDNEEFQKLGNFTDEQMMLIELAISDKLSTYLTLLENLNKEENPIYHIFVDRDWLYHEDDLHNFIDKAILLDKEGDL